MQDLRLPIGYDIFGEIVRNDLNIIDKSLFIRDVIDDFAKAIVITRPRRFGKTTNLSMLHYFFAAEAYGESTEGLFEGMQILNAGEKYLAHYRKYPVIFISFKDVKDHRYENTFASLRELIAQVYSEHRFLLSSEHLDPDEKIFFKNILSRTANEETIKSSLRNLTAYLHRATSIKPWLFIDEYDTPIQSVYLHGYYDEVISLMRSLLGSVLKSNPYLHKSVITGILRIAKESLFSGVNNLRVYSVLQPEYSQYFGFTEAEVVDVAAKAQLENLLPQIKDWYNGYQIGPTTLYNPWSIVNCMRDKDLRPYWVNTSDNALIKSLLLQSSNKFKEDFEELLQDKPVQQFIDENVVFGDLDKSETAVWSLLLMAGYLKVIAQNRTDLGFIATLQIPNREVKNLYRQIVLQGLADGHGLQRYKQFIDDLLNGKLELFEKTLREIMEQVVSTRDMGKQPEAFYHGFMLGLTASIHGKAGYELKSNRESGNGLYDYVIIAEDKNKPSIIFEFKKIEIAKKDLSEVEELLLQSAKKAVDQINHKNYIAELKQRGVTRIIKIALAFCGKQFKMHYEDN
jgi:hypothetical protein